MNILTKRCGGQRGAVAVELALVLPILILLLTFTVFFARFFWHYTVAQKAAYDAARYLSTVSEQEMRDGVLASAAADVATQIARAELAELRPGRNGKPKIEVQCGGESCTGVWDTALPETVSVTVRMGMFDDFFNVIDTGRYGLLIVGRSEMRYVGN